MKSKRKIAACAILAACLVAAGCASTDPASVERSIRDFTAKKQFDRARAVPVQAGTLFETDEEITKKRLIAQVVNPAEIKFICENVSRQVDKELAKRPPNYGGARNIVWDVARPGTPAVHKGVSEFLDGLMRKINAKQFVDVTNAMDKAVSKHLAANDYAGARKYLRSIRPIQPYAGDVGGKLAEIRAELARMNVPSAVADEAMAAAKPVLEAVFADETLERVLQKVETKRPDRDLFDEKIAEFRKTLANRDCSPADADKAVAAILTVADPAIRGLHVTKEGGEIAPPEALGITSLNRLVAAERDRLYAEKVVPAEVADRIKALRKTIVPLIKAESYEEARNAIFEFGTTGIPEVDDPVFAVKLAFLNARANPAILERACRELPATVDERLAANDIPGAIAAIKDLKDAPAYDEAVDGHLDASAREAVKLDVPEKGASSVVGQTKGVLYGITAPRPSQGRESRLMRAYYAAIGGAKPAEVDWSAVRKCLDAAAERLVADDMPRTEADALMDDVLAAFKALLATKPGVRAITTEQLNEALAALRAEQMAKIATAAKAKAKGKKDAKPTPVEVVIDIDYDTRINSFIKEIANGVEPNLARILGDAARVLRLLRIRANVTPGDATSLFVASIYMGFDDTARLALSLGADINGTSPKDGLRRPAILLALRYGFKGEAASMLATADRTVRDANSRVTVHYAVHGCNGTALVELLQLGIDAKTPDAAGETPLVLAADWGYTGILGALIPYSDLEAADKDGFTALLRAAQNGRTDIVRILLAAGADIDAKSKDGDGLIELAAKANGAELLAYLLDERKLPPTARVVRQLVAAGKVQTLELMVEHGATLTDDHLALAVQNRAFPMVKYLVNRGLDVNAPSVKKATGEGGGTNDGSYYGPDGGTIQQFLYGQGQR